MIAFDFDGVICDTHHIFRGHFWDRFGVNCQREVEQDTYEINLKDSEYYEPWWWDEIPVAITKYQHICPPHTGAIEAMRQMYFDYDMPYIKIVTAREPSNAVMGVTQLWCRRNFNFPYDISFCSSPDEKAHIMKKLDIRYFVDDRFKTAQELAPNLKYSYLLNRKWNEREAPLLPNVERINTLWDMKRHLDLNVAFV